MMNALQAGDVVQIDPAYGVQAFAGCFLVVSEIKSWGIIGYVPVLGTFDTLEKAGAQGRLAYVRLPMHAFVRIGVSEWRRQD